MTVSLYANRIRCGWSESLCCDLGKYQRKLDTPVGRVLYQLTNVRQGYLRIQVCICVFRDTLVPLQGRSFVKQLFIGRIGFKCKLDLIRD